MKKRILGRALIGFPVGISIENLIMIFISAVWANGYFVPCVPDLISTMGNELNAVIIQNILCGLLGSGFAVSSLIWEKEEWSLLKQTGIYFLAICVIMLPVAYFLHWMEHSFTGFISYFGIFVLIFAAMWIIQFIAGKNSVKNMNKKLSEARNYSFKN